MKTLITILAVLTLSSTTLLAKDGAFTSEIIPDGGNELRLTLSSHQWLRITNFSQIPTSDANLPTPAGVAVFKGGDGLWVKFASDPKAHAPHEDIFVGGPATVVVSPPQILVNGNPMNGGATVFLTYQRGSD